MEVALGLAWKAVADLAVDQTRDDDHALGVVLAVMVVNLSQGLVASDASDGVFDLNAMTGKSPIKRFIFRGAFLSTGFPPWCGAFAQRMFFGHSHIGQVAPGAHIQSH